MKKKDFILLSLVLIGVLSLLISSFSPAQNGFKLGVVDTQSVFENYKKAKEANDILKTAEDRLTDRLKRLQEEIATMEERLTKQKLFLDAPDTESLENDIRLKRQELQHDFKKGQEAIVEKQKELVEPILKEIEDLLKQIGESEGYSLILEKRLVTLYVDPQYDLTERVTKLLDDKHQKEQVKAQQSSTSPDKATAKEEAKVN
jgi:outer membrane protein